jgi:hypothetical protein
MRVDVLEQAQLDPRTVLQFIQEVHPLICHFQVSFDYLEATRRVLLPFTFNN